MPLSHPLRCPGTWNFIYIGKQDQSSGTALVSIPRQSALDLSRLKFQSTNNLNFRISHTASGYPFIKTTLLNSLRMKTGFTSFF